MQTLFDIPAPTPLELGHAAAERAADHAGETWKDQAFRAFVAYVREHGECTTEQVRQACPHVPEPPDKRAWGSVALRAARAGVVRSAGWTRASSPTVHGMVVTLWRLEGP